MNSVIFSIGCALNLYFENYINRYKKGFCMSRLSSMHWSLPMFALLGLIYIEFIFFRLSTSWFDYLIIPNFVGAFFLSIVIDKVYCLVRDKLKRTHSTS